MRWVSTTFKLLCCSLCLFSGLRVFAEEPNTLGNLRINPAELTLTGPDLKYRLLVEADDDAGFVNDLSREVVFSSRDESIATVSPEGKILGLKDGQTEIIAKYGDQEAVLTLTIQKSDRQRQLHFENDITPIFNKFSCNGSGCHGKAEGQNGFKLSVFGFDPEQDRLTLVSESRGRRIFPAAPEKSLLLMKASGDVPHGGGIHIRKGSEEYQLLYDWIQSGMPIGDPQAPQVASIEVTPGEQRMKMNSEQQLRVVATYSDGHKVDVTRHAKFQSNNEPLATVDDKGLVHIHDIPGEVAVMASYMGAVNVFRALIPQQDFEFHPNPAPSVNFIDDLVESKLEKLNISSSGLCSDEDYLRRVYLDVIGTLPTVEETRHFLADTSPDRRERLVSELLDRPEYATYWALKWSDLLRVDRLKLGRKGSYNYYNWIRTSFEQNKPFDQFASELLTAEGPITESPSGYFFKAVDDPGQAASTVAQVFLGIRIECAQCHHHPTDRWSQSDYYGMRALFSQVQFKPSEQGEMLETAVATPTMHPRTGEEVMPRPLGSEQNVNSDDIDRREVMADWLTSHSNEWFAQNVVNRVWAHFLGRGIIEPVDDIRSTNPPTNPELLAALTKYFIEHDYDLHQLIQLITRSRTYQLSSETNPSNERDEQNYSRALLKTLQAEVLLDAICQVTGVEEKFAGVPAGARSIELWDSQVPHYFLKLFG
ncbi:MAG: DUF1549 domain-containing protein, partial [Planctomycetaceae bacterium]|nr:DUF1549 domain-containing protein [Planctomycetaceae bacterium]